MTMTLWRWVVRFTTFGGVVFLLFGCNATKYLKDGELLLTKNRVELQVDMNNDDKSSLSYQLWTIAKQKPNSKFFTVRLRLWAYNQIMDDLQNNPADTSRFHKWMLHNFAEPPVAYNRSLMESSVQTMEYYLNNQGYFYASVEADTIPKPKKRYVEVVYKVKSGKPLTISRVQFETTDDTLRTLLPELDNQTLLKKGQPLSKNIFTNEKNRIARALQNQGFAFFYPNYIFFEGDSTQTAFQSDVKVNIVPPSDTSTHQRYRIGNVYIYTNYNPLNRINAVLDTIEEAPGFFFIREKSEEKPIIKPTPILNCFVFKKGDWYAADAFENTRKQLVTLNVYKFVRIKTEIRTDQSNTLDYVILLNPAKKMEFGADLELNTVTGGSGSINNAIGIFANLNYKNRNTFRGAELFSLNPVGGVEFATNQPDRLFNTIDVRVQSEIASPIIRKGLLKDAKVKAAASYNYISRIQQFRYNLLTVTGGFDWQFPQSRHIFNPISVNLLTPTIAPEFQPTLDDNPFLARSFDRQFIIGANYSYAFSSSVNKAGESYHFQANTELVGSSVWLLDQLIDPSESFKIFGDITYSQYGRLDLEASYTKRYSRNTSLALRANSGIGVAYGNASELPYIKQFYAGGTSSIRAWRVREIGPGGFFDSTLTATTIPYQTGDFKLELNAELRFMLWGAYDLQGALFVDGGNVWTLKEDPNRPLSQLTTNFWKQIGAGAGFGVRRDFSYFIIRLDWAFKILTPYESDDNLFLNRLLPPRWYVPVWNLAIGYPF